LLASERINHFIGHVAANILLLPNKYSLPHPIFLDSSIPLAESTGATLYSCSSRKWNRAMFRTLRPLLTRIQSGQAERLPLIPMTVVAPPVCATCLPESQDRPTDSDVVDEPSVKAKKRSKTSLKDRLQSESSSFAFDSLLHDSTAANPTRTSINAKDGAELVWIAPGEFAIGGRENSGQHTVGQTLFLNGFWIYKTPVTVAQYRKFYHEIGRNLQHAPQWGWDDEHPVVNVSWRFAQAYAHWAGADLPSEAEWERAASGAGRFQFPWGNEWDAGRCHNSVASKQSCPARVNSYKDGASPEGAEDMAGNVWEWTADWFEQPSYSLSHPTIGSPESLHRVLRGGSWGNEEISDYRVTTRVPCAPDARGESIGFRCVVRPESVCQGSP
jgi:formylglycine-generating enzyme required for sulfatase activity